MPSDTRKKILALTMGDENGKNVLPGVTKDFEPAPPPKPSPARRKRKRNTYSDDEREQIAYLRSSGWDVQKISDHFHIAPRIIERALDESRTDDVAGVRFQNLAQLAGLITQKAQLLLTSVTKKSVEKALESGKLADVVKSADILTKLRSNVVEDLDVRAGADNLGNAKDLRALVADFRKHAVPVLELAKRTDTLAATPVPKDDADEAAVAGA
jgi:hypothetical protein